MAAPKARSPTILNQRAMRLNIKIFLIIFTCLLLLPGKHTHASELKRTIITDGLSYPWAVAFLPDGSFLVTEKPGKLLKISPDGKKAEIDGLPAIVARRQGGLLDIILDPDFKTNRLIYFSYVGRGMGGTSTEVARAALIGNNLSNLQTIFKAKPKMRSDLHFGSRLLFAPDGTLFITLGERFKMQDAQNLKNHHGALVRINPDGSVPDDNPFTGQKGAKPEIYSYGHRNMQGIALQPGTDTIWTHEHGPQGGDEVNIIRPGVNYGWPVISYGIDYDGSIITDKTEAPGMAQPVIHWTPSIAPCGMAFYNGDKFPDWRGDLFVGALAGAHLRRLDVEGQEIIEQEVLLTDLEERIRDVRAGPDGYLYILTDSHDGKLIRLEPLP